MKNILMKISIYIPHWLDSMVVLDYKNGNRTINLHSTLVRFYAKSSHKIAILSPHLHSTLVRFYENNHNIMFFFIPIYIPHWLDSML